MADSSIPQVLFEILAGYAALVPQNNICYPKQCPPHQIHDFCLEHILLNPHFQQYPPSKQYQLAFWKWVIKHLENTLVNEDAEIDPRIYDHYLALLPSSGPALGPPQPHVIPQLCPGGLPKSGPPSDSYLTYFWTTRSSESTDDTVILSQRKTATLRESRSLIEGGTTGLRTWLASFVLAQYLIDHPDLILDKTILELGSGVGFLGIIISSLQILFDASGANSSIWLTDVNETVLRRCSDNLSLICNLSSTHPNIHHQLLDWSAALDPFTRPGLSSFLSTDVSADLILGADIVFDPTLIPALIATIHLALASSPSPSPNQLPNPHDTAPKETTPNQDDETKSRKALIAITVRNAETLNLFLSTAKEHLELKEIQLDPRQKQSWVPERVDGLDGQSVRLYELTTRQTQSL